MGLWRSSRLGLKGKLPQGMGDNVRTCRKKRVKGLSLAGHEEVPRAFGLRTGDHSDTVDGAGNYKRPAQLSTDYWEKLGL